ncbi:hypothetical protein ABQF34_05410 [Mycolicibacterium boenickei]
MGRGINWRTVLIVVGVIGIAVALIWVAAVVYFMYAFDKSFRSDEFGLHDIDAATAATAMEHRGIDIPDGYTFGAMTVYAVFTGADTYAGRYAAPGVFAAAKHGLAEANPEFPALRNATCDDEIVQHDFPDVAGFRCDVGTELAVSTRTLDGADVLTDNYAGTPPDTETLLLMRNGERVELFVLSRGH